MAVDSAGNVYIPRFYGSDVVVYPKGSTHSVEDLVEPGEVPVDVAVAGDGTVYVANLMNSSGGHGSIAVFKNGVLKRIINDGNFDRLWSVAVDEHHLLIGCYAANGKTGCDEFPGGVGNGATVISNIGTPYGVAFDKSENIVVNDGGSNQILVYPPAGGSPCNTIPQTGNPVALAFDRTQKHLFVADGFNNDVIQQSYSGCSGGGSVQFTYNTGWSPSGVVVDNGPNP
jgi:hypothetical protein